jgi:hypothetical protein
MSARRLMLPLMAALLAAYVVVHSPAQRVLARAVGMGSGTCYFICAGWADSVRLLDAVAVAACLVLVWRAALLLVRGLPLGRAERLLLFALVALALVVVPAGWLGLVAWLTGDRLLQPPVGPLLTALPAAAIVLAGLVRRRPSERILPTGLPWLGVSAVLAGTALLLLIVGSAVSLAHPPTGYDALSYHGPLAVYYWREGDIGGFLVRQPWAWALAHPGAAELWFGLLRVGAGERIASLGQLPLAIVGAIAVHILGRWSGLPARLALLGGLAFLVAPIVVVQSGMQLNDLAAGALVLSALALAAAPPEQWSRVRFGGIGLALGLAVTTKLAVVPAAAGIVLYLAVRLRHAPQWRRLLGPGLLLFAAAVAPWWIRNLMLYGNPIYPAALPLLGRGYVVGDFARKDGWFVPNELLWPLYPLLEPHGEMSGLGALFAVAALPGAAVALVRARRGPLVLLGIVGTVSAVAWWLLTQHEPRLILGVLAAGFAGVGWAVLAVPRAHRRHAVRVVGVAAVFSAAVTVDQALRPLASAPGDRGAFYEEEWGIDSAVAGLPASEGLLYHTGYAHRSYAGDYPLLGPRQARTITVIDGVLPTDSIVAIMRTWGLRYAYVPAGPAAWDTVIAMYPPQRFERARISSLARGSWVGTRRYLFRLQDAGPR